MADSSDLKRGSGSHGDETVMMSREHLDAALSSLGMSLEDYAHYLVPVRESGHGLPREITSSATVIGRGPDVDWRLPDTKTSKRHCSVRVEGGKLVVTDLNSTNGTYVSGTRITGSATVPAEASLRIGSFVFRHEYRNRAAALEERLRKEEIGRAVDYVTSLLPGPVTGGPVRTDWCFVPSAALGGDIFGYQRRADGRFAMYLIDVSGHGAGAAMHSVSIANVLHGQALSQSDSADPGQVLSELNNVFQMDDHGGMFFTIWYGVYDPETCSLDYASGGHPPALLRPAEGGRTQQLRTRYPPLGITPERSYAGETVEVEHGSRLYLFSDGVFEVITTEGKDWTFEEFEQRVCLDRIADLTESERIRQVVSEVSGRARWEDDFSLVVLTFEHEPGLQE